MQEAGKVKEQRVEKETSMIYEGWKAARMMGGGDVFRSPTETRPDDAGTMIAETSSRNFSFWGAESQRNTKAARSA